MQAYVSSSSHFCENLSTGQDEYINKMSGLFSRLLNSTTTTLERVQTRECGRTKVVVVPPIHYCALLLMRSYGALVQSSALHTERIGCHLKTQTRGGGFLTGIQRSDLSGEIRQKLSKLCLIVREEGY
jgi:hypothetical protein